MTGVRSGVRGLVPLVALAAVYTTAITVMRMAPPQGVTVLSAAVAFDLTVTASALVWWLGVRRAGWPRWTVGLTFAAGGFAGRTFLPGSVVVTALIGLWLLIETSIIVLAAVRIRTVVRVARAHRGPGPVDAVEAGLIAAKAPPWFAAIVASDLMAFVLGLSGWFRRAPRDGFAMHRRKSWTAIAMIFLLLITVETVAVHLLLAQWSAIVAWIVTGSSIYAALWLSADLHAMRLYPLRVTDDALVGAVGLRWRLAIPREAITAVALADATPDGALSVAIVEPTVVITLARPILVRGPFGIRRTPTMIALTVDEPERFIAALAPA